MQKVFENSSYEHIHSVAKPRVAGSESEVTTRKLWDVVLQKKNTGECPKCDRFLNILIQGFWHMFDHFWHLPLQFRGAIFLEDALFWHGKSFSHDILLAGSCRIQGIRAFCGAGTRPGPGSEISQERKRERERHQHRPSMFAALGRFYPRSFFVAKLGRFCSHDFEEHEKSETQSGTNEPVGAPRQLEAGQQEHEDLLWFLGKCGSSVKWKDHKRSIYRSQVVKVFF